MSDNKVDVLGKVNAEFKNTLVRDVLKAKFTNTKLKINEEHVNLMAEVLKVMTVEAAMRASAEATSENKPTVDLNHIERVLPSLLLDFP